MVNNLNDSYKNNVIKEKIEALFNQKEISLKVPLNKRDLKKLLMRVKEQNKKMKE